MKSWSKPWAVAWQLPLRDKFKVRSWVLDVLSNLDIWREGIRQGGPSSPLLPAWAHSSRASPEPTAPVVPIRHRF